MKLCILWLLSIACLCCLSLRSSAQPDVDATLLEAQQDSLCYADCPVIPLPNIYGVYYYCFQVGDKLLVGEHQAWEFGLKGLYGLQGKSISLHFDDNRISVKLPRGWSVHLNQYYNEYPFKNPSCRAATKTRSLERGYTRPQPVPGEPAKPVMRGKLVYGWSLCNKTAYQNEWNCQVWDLKGDIRQKGTYTKVVDDLSSLTSEQKTTMIDTFEILHLKDGNTFRLLSPPLLEMTPKA